MKIKKIESSREKVIFDSIRATYPGGVPLSLRTEHLATPTDKIVAGGTVIVKNENGSFSPIEGKPYTKEKLKNAVGLLRYDITLDEELAPVVQSGTVRIQALPEREVTGIALLKDALPNLIFI